MVEADDSKAKNENASWQVITGANLPPELQEKPPVAHLNNTSVANNISDMFLAELDHNFNQLHAAAKRQYGDAGNNIVIGKLIGKSLSIVDDKIIAGTQKQTKSDEPAEMGSEENSSSVIRLLHKQETAPPQPRKHDAALAIAKDGNGNFQIVVRDEDPDKLNSDKPTAKTMTDTRGVFAVPEIDKSKKPQEDGDKSDGPEPTWTRDKGKSEWLGIVDQRKAIVAGKQVSISRSVSDPKSLQAEVTIGDQQIKLRVDKSGGYFHSINPKVSTKTAGSVTLNILWLNHAEVGPLLVGLLPELEQMIEKGEISGYKTLDPHFMDRNWNDFIAKDTYPIFRQPNLIIINLPPDKLGKVADILDKMCVKKGLAIDPHAEEYNGDIKDYDITRGRSESHRISIARHEWPIAGAMDILLDAELTAGLHKKYDQEYKLKANDPLPLGRIERELELPKNTLSYTSDGKLTMQCGRQSFPNSATKQVSPEEMLRIRKIYCHVGLEPGQVYKDHVQAEMEAKPDPQRPFATALAAPKNEAQNANIADQAKPIADVAAKAKPEQRQLAMPMEQQTPMDSQQFMSEQLAKAFRDSRPYYESLRGYERDAAYFKRELARQYTALSVIKGQASTKDDRGNPTPNETLLRAQIDQNTLELAKCEHAAQISLEWLVNKSTGGGETAEVEKIYGKGGMWHQDLNSNQWCYSDIYGKGKTPTALMQNAWRELERSAKIIVRLRELYEPVTQLEMQLEDLKHSKPSNYPERAREIQQKLNEKQAEFYNTPAVRKLQIAYLVNTNAVPPADVLSGKSSISTPAVENESKATSDARIRELFMLPDGTLDERLRLGDMWACMGSLKPDEIPTFIQIYQKALQANNFPPDSAITNISKVIDRGNFNSKERRLWFQALVGAEVNEPIIALVGSFGTRTNESDLRLLLDGMKNLKPEKMPTFIKIREAISIGVMNAPDTVVNDIADILQQHRKCFTDTQYKLWCQAIADAQKTRPMPPGNNPQGDFANAFLAAQKAQKAAQKGGGEETKRAADEYKEFKLTDQSKPKTVNTKNGEVTITGVEVRKGKVSVLVKSDSSSQPVEHQALSTALDAELIRSLVRFPIGQDGATADPNLRAAALAGVISKLSGEKLTELLAPYERREEALVKAFMNSDKTAMGQHYADVIKSMSPAEIPAFFQAYETALEAKGTSPEIARHNVVYILDRISLNKDQKDAWHQTLNTRLQKDASISPLPGAKQESGSTDSIRTVTENDSTGQTRTNQLSLKVDAPILMDTQLFASEHLAKAFRDCSRTLEDIHLCEIEAANIKEELASQRATLSAIKEQASANDGSEDPSIIEKSLHDQIAQNILDLAKYEHGVQAYLKELADNSLGGDETAKLKEIYGEGTWSQDADSKKWTYTDLEGKPHSAERVVQNARLELERSAKIIMKLSELYKPAAELERQLEELRYDKPSDFAEHEKAIKQQLKEEQAKFCNSAEVSELQIAYLSNTNSIPLMNEEQLLGTRSLAESVSKYITRQTETREYEQEVGFMEQHLTKLKERCTQEERSPTTRTEGKSDSVLKVMRKDVSDCELAIKRHKEGLSALKQDSSFIPDGLKDTYDLSLKRGPGVLAYDDKSSRWTWKSKVDGKIHNDELVQEAGAQRTEITRIVKKLADLYQPLASANEGLANAKHDTPDNFKRIADATRSVLIKQQELINNPEFIRLKQLGYPTVADRLSRTPPLDYDQVFGVNGKLIKDYVAIHDLIEEDKISITGIEAELNALRSDLKGKNEGTPEKQKVLAEIATKEEKLKGLQNDVLQWKLEVRVNLAPGGMAMNLLKILHGENGKWEFNHDLSRWSYNGQVGSLVDAARKEQEHNAERLYELAKSYAGIAHKIEELPKHARTMDELYKSRAKERPLLEKQLEFLSDPLVRGRLETMAQPIEIASANSAPEEHLQEKSIMLVIEVKGVPLEFDKHSGILDRWSREIPGALWTFERGPDGKPIAKPKLPGIIQQELLSDQIGSLQEYIATQSAKDGIEIGDVSDVKITPQFEAPGKAVNAGNVIGKEVQTFSTGNQTKSISSPGIGHPIQTPISVAKASANEMPRAAEIPSPPPQEEESVSRARRGADGTELGSLVDAKQVTETLEVLMKRLAKVASDSSNKAEQNEARMLLEELHTLQTSPHMDPVRVCEKVHGLVENGNPLRRKILIGAGVGGALVSAGFLAVMVAREALNKEEGQVAAKAPSPKLSGEKGASPN